MNEKYRTRCLGGSLLVAKATNDCVTIERGANGRPGVVFVESDWTEEEIREAIKFWYGSDAEKR